MNCKFCNAELDEGVSVCPQCGKELTEDASAEQEAPCDCCGPELTEVTEAAVEETAAEEPETAGEQPQEEEAPKKKRIGRIVVTAVCGVLLLGILVAAILVGSGIDLGPHGEGILYKSSYTVEEAASVKKANAVVARVNGKELKNAELQAHYFGNIYQFMSSYGYDYFDFSKPLDSQMFDEEKGMTWQQYFLDSALINWHRYQILYALSEEEGFTADLSGMETLRSDLEAAAEQYGFESVDDLIHADMGDACSFEDYLNYITLTHYINQYVEHMYETWKPTLEDLEAYYAANEQAFIQGGLSKDSGNIVDVRHILIMPKGEKTDGAFSEQQWKDARKEAERILALWKSGEATEESFAALAGEYTEDGGSKNNGGLYQGITAESPLVENFLAWCMDPARAVGDTDIVETEYGYHIMYFSFSEPIWMTAARDNYMPYKLNQIIAENEERWPLDVIYRNIVVTDINVPEAE